MTDTAARLRSALSADDASARLRAAMTAGTSPHDEQVDVLIERSAVEPDFFVRDMLTWALMRHRADVTVPRLLDEVRSGGAQARRQALHSLSKIRDPRGWDAITPELLADDDETTARTAWRAAALLAPGGAKAELAGRLAQQLGRGDRDLQHALSRSFVTLRDAADGALDTAARRGDANARRHAIATQRFALDEDEDFDAAMVEAERMLAGLAAGGASGSASAAGSGGAPGSASALEP